LVPDHTMTACAALADISVDKAVALADATAVSSTSPGSEPPYEQWRLRIRAHFAVE